jgi:hypothetical protein
MCMSLNSLFRKVKNYILKTITKNVVIEINIFIWAFEWWELENDLVVIKDFFNTKEHKIK